MARNPAQHILDAEAAIAQRKKQIAGEAEDKRQPIAIEAIADELTMLRAEIKYLREAMAVIAASLAHRR